MERLFRRSGRALGARVALLVAAVAIPGAAYAGPADRAAENLAPGILRVHVPPPGRVTIALFAARARPGGKTSGPVARPTFRNARELKKTAIAVADLGRQKRNHGVVLLGVMVMNKATGKRAPASAAHALGVADVWLKWAPSRYGRPVEVGAEECGLAPPKALQCTRVPGEPLISPSYRWLRNSLDNYGAFFITPAGGLSLSEAMSYERRAMHPATEYATALMLLAHSFAVPPALALELFGELYVVQLDDSAAHLFALLLRNLLTSYLSPLEISPIMAEFVPENFATRYTANVTDLEPVDPYEDDWWDYWTLDLTLIQGDEGKPAPGFQNTDPKRQDYSAGALDTGCDNNGHGTSHAESGFFSLSLHEGDNRAFVWTHPDAGIIPSYHCDHTKMGPHGHEGIVTLVSGIDDWECRVQYWGTESGESTDPNQPGEEACFPIWPLYPLAITAL